MAILNSSALTCEIDHMISSHVGGLAHSKFLVDIAASYVMAKHGWSAESRPELQALMIARCLGLNVPMSFSSR